MAFKVRLTAPERRVSQNVTLRPTRRSALVLLGAERLVRQDERMSPGTITLWRPVGQAELDLIEASAWRRFPPRLLGQPIFYPVLNQAYATKIARDWNTKDPASGYVGYVLQFAVDSDYAERFEHHRVGGAGIDELWVPAEQLDEFNDHIVGPIAVVSEHRFVDEDS